MNATKTTGSAQLFDRTRLLIDLDEATDPSSPASSLLVLGLPHPGEDREEGFSSTELDELVVHLRDRLVELVGDNGSVYRTRSTELCAFIDGGLSPTDDILDAIRTELDLECEPLAVRVSLGCVSLPGEAGDAAAALALADERARHPQGPIVLRLPSRGTPRTDD